MNYIYDIKVAILVYPLIALLLTIPYMILQYRKYGSINSFRTLIVFSFIFYLLCMYLLVIFPLPNITDIAGSYLSKINLKPFMFVKDFLRENPFVLNDIHTYKAAIKHYTFYVPVFNVIMFIPLGMYLRYYYKCSFAKTVFIGLLVSLFFELTQLTGLYFIYEHPYRLCDVDDLIQNGSGTIVGYILFSLFKNILPDRDSIDDRSYIKGIKVSGIRYMLSFMIDLFIILIFSVFFMDKFIYVFIITFILYHSLLPQFRGGTIGMSLLKIKVEFSKHKRIRYCLRSVLMFLYYFGTLFIFFISLEKFGNSSYGNLIFIGLFIVVMVNFFTILFVMLFNRRHLYDVIMKSAYVSKVKINRSNIE